MATAAASADAAAAATSDPTAEAVSKQLAVSRAQRDAAIAAQAVLTDELRRAEERARKFEADYKSATEELQRAILEKKQAAETGTPNRAFGFITSPFSGSRGRAPGLPGDSPNRFARRPSAP